MLRFLMNVTGQDGERLPPRTYEIIEYSDDGNNGVLFARVVCSEVASHRIIKALNATSTAGSARSEAKAAAARANGAKGGRPKNLPLLKCCGKNMELVGIGDPSQVLPCCDTQYWCDSCGSVRHRYDCSRDE
jgi:hypothetical protein